MQKYDLSKICPTYIPAPSTPPSKLVVHCQNLFTCKYKIDDERDSKFCKFNSYTGHYSNYMRCENKEVMKDLILIELRELM